MPRKKLVINPDGTSDEEDMTTEEEDALDADQAAYAPAVEARTDHEANVALYAPDGALQTKLRDGTALSAGELEQVARWVALIRLGPEAP
jgi:hypothetical protein